MISNIKFHSSADRSEVLNYIIDNKLKAVDIGGATSFADGHLEAIIDFNPPAAKAKKIFQGNINFPDMWQEVFKYVEQHGKFDFAICTHTLEDISNPAYVCQCIDRIAKAGFIAFPSKYHEFGRFGTDTYRGFIHHRWIYDIIDGELIGFPKINYIENRKYDAIAAHPDAVNRYELSLWWEGETGLKIINNDWLGPDEESVKGYYDLLLTDL